MDVIQLVKDNITDTVGGKVFDTISGAAQSAYEGVGEMLGGINTKNSRNAGRTMQDGIGYWNRWHSPLGEFYGGGTRFGDNYRRHKVRRGAISEGSPIYNADREQIRAERYDYKRNNAPQRPLATIPKYNRPDALPTIGHRDIPADYGRAGDALRANTNRILRQYPAPAPRRR